MLKTNSLSLGKLDSHGCDIHLRDGFLTLHDGLGRLLSKTPKTRGNMYLLKLNIVKHCLLIKNNDDMPSFYVVEGYVIKVLTHFMIW